jgi:UDP-N-acetylmuramoyl-tripeptide--D-alanyl-D-alanine ligase
LVIERGREVRGEAGCAVVEVASPKAALGCLAAAWRREFELHVIAVGGSNGKTTTKELLASVVSRRFLTLRSPASFNNDVGVPLTLLQLEASHRAAVLEVGTNHPGELAPLVRMIRPRVGVVTSVGREHLEHFGTLEGVAAEEGWLAELIPADGMLFVNGDSPLMERVIRRCPAPVVQVGVLPHNDWRGTVRSISHEVLEFRVEAPSPAHCGTYRVALPGRHQMFNTMLAVAVGAHLGLSREEVTRGLANCTALPRRMESWMSRGIRVLDDAYNANADSVLAALQTLRDVPCEGRRIAVLGDMAELGERGPALHAEVGAHAALLKVDQLFAVGRMAAVVGAAARRAGLMRVLEFADPAAVVGPVLRFARAGDVVLVKASRVLQLERVSDALRQASRAA